MEHRLYLAIIFLGIAACGDAEGGARRWFSSGNEARYTVSTGDARLDASGRLGFEVTSDTYRRWTRAQAALGRSDLARFVAGLGRRGLTQEELDAAIQRVEQSSRARAAIENAGMTPVEYVYATIAIEQAMAVASGKFQPRAPEPSPYDVDVAGVYGADSAVMDTTVIVMPEAPAYLEPLPPAMAGALPPVMPEPLPSLPPESLPPVPAPTLPPTTPPPSDTLPPQVPLPPPSDPQPMPSVPAPEPLPPIPAPLPAPIPTPTPTPSPIPSDPAPPRPDAP